VHRDDFLPQEELGSCESDVRLRHTANSEGWQMVNDSVGALHVALAAAVVGWLVFCVSHSFSVWKKRNVSGDAKSSHGLLIVSLLLCAAALAAG